MKLYANQIEEYIKCGYRYYLRNVIKVPNIYSLKVIIGKKFHNVIENDLEHFKKQNKYMKAEELVELWENLIFNELEDKENNSNANDEIKFQAPDINEWNEIMETINGIINQYVKIRMQSFFKPMLCQNEQNINIDQDLIIAGKYDIIFKMGFAFFQIKKSIVKDYNPYNNLQLAINNLILNEIFDSINTAYYIQLCPNNYNITSIIYKDYMIIKTKEIILNTAKAIKKEIFLPCIRDIGYNCLYCQVNKHCKYLFEYENKEKGGEKSERI